MEALDPYLGSNVTEIDIERDYFGRWIDLFMVAIALAIELFTLLFFSPV